MKKIFVPPIKCQGIKTKLVSWIKDYLVDYNGIWIEPFMGSGVVGFNVMPKKAVFCDSNPYIIMFYNDLKNNKINSAIIKNFLLIENEKLLEGKDEYYKEVRSRFNNSPNSLDFLFLNRACFNGVIRFNRKGLFNTPFCKKPNRFATSYITKICNQVSNIQQIIEQNDYTFINQDFYKSIKMATSSDFIYCDPPYIDRYADYYNGWNEIDEIKLFELLNNTDAKFLMSSWYGNEYRENKYIKSLWKNFNISIRNHYYHIGAKERNRNPMTEAIIYNYNIDKIFENNISIPKSEFQLSFLEKIS